MFPKANWHVWYCCSLMSDFFCDCSPSGSSVHGILQARILEWVAMPFSRGFSQFRDWTRVSWVACFAFNLTKFYVLSVWVVLLGGVLIFLCVSHSIVSNSLWPHGLYSPLGASVHGILQGRILEWVTIPFSRGSSWPRDQTQVSLIADRFFTTWANQGSPYLYGVIERM